MGYLPKTAVHFPVVVRVDEIGCLNAVFGARAIEALLNAIHQWIVDAAGQDELVVRLPVADFAIAAKGADEDAVAARFHDFQRAVARHPVETAEGPLAATVSICLHNPVQVKDARMALDDMCDHYPHDRMMFGQAPPGPNAFIRHDTADGRKQAILSDRRQSANIIARALTDNRVRIALQPIVRAEDPTQVVSRECLARFVTPDGTLMSTGMLLPWLEDLGFARLVDRRVLCLAVQWLLAHPDGHLSVNLSARTLSDPDWFDCFEQLAADSPEAIERITVEITESTAISDRDLARKRVALIRAHKAKVALDDFGVGYLSFGHVRDLRPDILKIDGSYVRDLPENRDAVAFVRAIAVLAHHLGIKVAAEMAGTGAALDFLREEGVDYVQGYDYGKAALWNVALEGNASLF